MRTLPLLLTAALLLAAPQARAQPAPPPPPPVVTITLPELDELIRSLAEAPARFTLPALNFLLEKRQKATSPTPEAKAP
jgi:hypothetical protein